MALSFLLVIFIASGCTKENCLSHLCARRTRTGDPSWPQCYGYSKMGDRSTTCNIRTTPRRGRGRRFGTLEYLFDSERLEAQRFIWAWAWAQLTMAFSSSSTSVYCHSMQLIHLIQHPCLETSIAFYQLPVNSRYCIAPFPGSCLYMGKIMTYKNISEKMFEAVNSDTLLPS
jgi:hypothetical protein